MARRLAESGFTLIELMIVIVIIGILAAIAYPSYVRHIERSHIADGQKALLEVAQCMEREYTRGFSYPLHGSQALTDCIGNRSDFYIIALDQAESDAQRYRLVATATANKAGNRCAELWVNQLQGRGDAQNENCWR